MTTTTQRPPSPPDPMMPCPTCGDIMKPFAFNVTYFGPPKRTCDQILKCIPCNEYVRLGLKLADES